MVNIEKIKDDALLWRRVARRHPEIDEIVKAASQWNEGESYKVSLEKPYQSLRSALSRGLDGAKSVKVKRIDKEGREWYVKLEQSRAKRKKKVPATT